MRKKTQRRLKAALLWIVGTVVGAALGGFVALWAAYLLKPYLHARLLAPVAIGIAVTVSFFVLRLMRLQSKLFRTVSPLVAGLIAALGVHMSRTWLT